MVVSHSWPNTSEKSFHFVIKAQCFLCSPQPGHIKGFIVYLSANTEKESRPLPKATTPPHQRKMQECLKLQSTAEISRMSVFNAC